MRFKRLDGVERGRRCAERGRASSGVEAPTTWGAAGIERRPNSVYVRWQPSAERAPSCDKEQLPHRSILVAVERSVAADRAFAVGVALACRNRSRLTLLACYPDLLPAAPAIPGIVSPASPLEAELKAAARRLLMRACDLAGNEVLVTSVLRRGTLVRALVDRAISAEHDLIILGARSRLSRLAAARVSRACGVQVLLVDGEWIQEVKGLAGVVGWITTRARMPSQSR